MRTSIMFIIFKDRSDYRECTLTGGKSDSFGPLLRTKSIVAGTFRMIIHILWAGSHTIGLVKSQVKQFFQS